VVKNKHMKELIIIEEHCEEGVFSMPFDYNTLPDNVKKKVDAALKDEFHSIRCDIYQQGLQFLMREKHEPIKPGEETKYKGTVQLHSRY